MFYFQFSVILTSISGQNLIMKGAHAFMKLEIWIILMMLHNNKILVKYCLSELKNNVFEEDFLNIKNQLELSECFTFLTTEMYMNPKRLHS